MTNRVSVIIPIYNDYDKLEAVLEGFINQSYKNLEILIVDDGSEYIDNDLIENYSMKFQDFKFISQKENKGRSFTRNTGIKASTGDILLFNDADRIPEQNMVKDHVNTLSNDNKIISIGAIIDRFTLNENTYFDRPNSYFNVVEKLYNKLGVSKSDLVWLSTFSGNMAILSNEVVTFDEEFDRWGFEHFELGFRLFENGYQFKLNKKAKNFHLVHTRDKNFYKESIEDSYEIFYRKHPVESVKLLRKFLDGEISLIDYEKKATGKTTIEQQLGENYFNKIINF